MKTRITKSDLETLAYNINLYGFCEYKIAVSTRYGYYNVEGIQEESHRVLCVLGTGMTCKECYMFLLGMRKAYFHMKIER